MKSQSTATSAADRPSIGTKRRKRILALFVIAFLTWAAPAFIAQWSKLNQKTAEMLGLQKQKDQLQLANEQMKREVERLNDPEYIEQKIRTELHYYKQGETPFPTPKTNP